jgi:hypothetical protein
VDKVLLYFRETQLIRGLTSPDGKSFTEIDLGGISFEFPRLAIIVFFNQRLKAVELDVPPKLSETELRSLISSLAEDVLVEEPNSLAFSFPILEQAQRCGIGVVEQSLISEIYNQAYSKNLIPLHIVPIEALLQFNDEAPTDFILLLETNEKQPVRVYKNKKLSEAFELYAENATEVLSALKAKHKNLIAIEKIETLEDHLLPLCANLLDPKQRANFSLDFAISPKEIKLILPFLRTKLEHAVKAVILVFLVFAIIVGGGVLADILTITFLNVSLAKYMQVSAGANLEEEVKKISSKVNSLQNDVQQLSVLRYPNVFEVLSGFSKILSKVNLQLENFDYAPPKVTISGTSIDYGSIENLKKELRQERELFCATEKEDIKDLRKEKKFTFEILLCKG